MTKLEKQRLKLYNKEWIDDIVLDISQSKCWRQLLFSADYNQKFLINADTVCEYPTHFVGTKNMIINHKLQFYVSKVLECPEDFDEGAVIFKFESAEFPEVMRYSGNYDKKFFWE